jgi:hypothetical protein
MPRAQDAGATGDEADDVENGADAPADVTNDGLVE